MDDLTCYHCGETIENWQGNLMVDDEQWMKHKVPYVRPYCFPCTKELDDSGKGDKLHHIVNLYHIKDHPFLELGGLLLDISVGEQSLLRYSPQAIRDYIYVIAHALPDQSALDLIYAFTPDTDYLPEDDYYHWLNKRVNQSEE